METAYLETPLGTASVTWDHLGFTRISILHEAPVPMVTSQEAPESVRYQLEVLRRQPEKI